MIVGIRRENIVCIKVCTREQLYQEDCKTCRYSHCDFQCKTCSNGFKTENCEGRICACKNTLPDDPAVKFFCCPFWKQDINKAK